MNFYPENATISLSVPFVDLIGNTITPTSVTAILYDGDDVQIVDMGQVVDVPTGDHANVVIASAYNILGVGEIRAIRNLRVSLITATETIERSFFYAIEAEQRLVVMVNTFQSLEMAELSAIELPNAFGWTAATDEQKRAALTEAYRRITAIPMRCVPRDAVTGELLPDEEWYIDRDEWGSIGENAFIAFPTHFKRVLKRAQLLEAAEILTNDVVGRKRRQGIIEETIGESSVRFSENKIDYGVSSLAMNALAGYIRFNMRIARC